MWTKIAPLRTKLKTKEKLQFHGCNTAASSGIIEPFLRMFNDSDAF